MTWLPKIVSLDFETVERGKGASLDYYKDQFYIYSLAASWRNQAGEIKSFFTANERTIRAFMKRLHDTQVPVVVQNLMFEWGCTMTQFPDLDINWASDTKFLAASYDGGGRTWEKAPHAGWTEGLGLEAIASRFLPERDHGHKSEAHNWLKEHHGIKTKHGAHLDKLPLDILERYNIADTETTLKLHEVLDAELKEIAEESNWVGWEQPFEFYKGRCKMLAQAKIRGIPTKRDECFQYVKDIDTHIADVITEFRQWGGKHVAAIENVNKESYINAVKTEAYREKRRLYVQENPEEFHINIGSKKQLKELFVDRLGMTAKRLTPKKQPSFAKGVLWQWGEGGKILAKIDDRNLVQSQAANIYVAAEYDGKLHPDCKPNGTRTYRVASSEDRG